MAQVITFERYKPVARYDSLAWTQARIEEAADPDGPWTTVETINLSPVDSDPTQPATRNLTTEDASDTVGLWYRIVWVDATGDESLPTSPVQNTASATNLYVSADELKESLSLLGTTFADAEIDMAVATASAAIEGITGTRFYATSETRYYDADAASTELPVDDIVSVTSVAVDVDGDGSYSETWVNGTDFYLDPPNAALEGRPYNRITLRKTAGRRFPRYQRAVKVVGSFGWASAPWQVREAAKLLAIRFVRRRDVPFGIQTAGAETVAMARIGRIDPDVATLLDQIPGARRLQHGSVSLG